MGQTATLPKTNSLPLKIGLSTQEEAGSSSNHQFSGVNSLLVSGRVNTHTLELPPTQDSSHQQDYEQFLAGNPYKPSFARPNSYQAPTTTCFFCCPAMFQSSGGNISELFQSGQNASYWYGTFGTPGPATPTAFFTGEGGHKRDR